MQSATAASACSRVYGSLVVGPVPDFFCAIVGRLWHTQRNIPVWNISHYSTVHIWCNTCGGGLLFWGVRSLWHCHCSRFADALTSLLSPTLTVP